MKKIGVIAIVLGALPSLAWPMTLEEAHRAAVQKAETIAISETFVKEAEAEYRRRVGSACPTRTLNASELLQDTPGSSPGQVNVGNTIPRRSVPDVNLELDYVFFTGLREYASIAASKSDSRRRAFELSRAEQVLYGDVARAFYAVVEREREIKLVQGVQKTLQDRIVELQRFEKLGRSRLSERVTVEADEKQSEADLNRLQGELVSFQSLFMFLTDLTSMPVLEPGPDDVPPPPPLAECIADLSDRPDLSALRQAIETSRQAVKIESGAYWPTGELKSHYYGYEVGDQSQTDWDVGFFLTWPLFEGLRTRAAVREASAVLTRSDLQLRQAERGARSEVESAHAELSASIEQLRSLRDAVTLNEENFRLQSKEYRLGLVTNLDVLTAVRQLYETKLAAENTLSLTKIQKAVLDTAIGRTPKVKW